MNIEPQLLNSPATKQEREQFVAQYYPKNTVYGMPMSQWYILIALASIGLVAGILSYAVAQSGGVGFVLLLVAVISGVTILRNYLSYVKVVDQSVKTHRFAAANGLGYEYQLFKPVRNGLIFSNPTTRYGYIVDRIFRDGERPFEIGNYYYETVASYQRSVQPHLNGFMCITLDRHLPHMVLDTAKDDVKFMGVTIASLGVSYKKDQALTLEGDFNNYFTLYAPAEYKTDALYIFTPDLMALFIDTANMYNAEIVDNKLYIYSYKKFDLDTPETLERLFKILDTVGLKALKQTGNYRDSRAAEAGTIAENGTRLKKRDYSVLILVLIVLGIIGLFQI
jgi:hypothetical protein